MLPHFAVFIAALSVKPAKLLVAGAGRAKRQGVDHVIQTLSHKPITSYPWWQAATYLLRPNVRTLGAIERRRAAAFAGRVVAPGTVSVHVRKGDKWVEVRALLDNVVLYQASENCIRFSCLQRKAA